MLHAVPISSGAPCTVLRAVLLSIPSFPPPGARSTPVDMTQEHLRMPSVPCITSCLNTARSHPQRQRILPEGYPVSVCNFNLSYLFTYRFIGWFLKELPVERLGSNSIGEDALKLLMPLTSFSQVLGLQHRPRHLNSSFSYGDTEHLIPFKLSL